MSHPYGILLPAFKARITIIHIDDLTWRDCVGIEPTRPGTQVSSSFEDCGGHQYPFSRLKIPFHYHSSSLWTINVNYSS
jgi:hypothetical protein